MEKIDLVIYILIALVALHIIGAILRTYVGWYRDGDKLRAAVRRAIDKGQFADALEVCESGLARKPYYSQLLWLQAEILFRMENYERSLEKFKYLQENEPLWSDDAKKYIETIGSKF